MKNEMIKIFEPFLLRILSLGLDKHLDLLFDVLNSKQNTSFMKSKLNELRADLQPIFKTDDLRRNNNAGELIEAIDEALEIIQKAEKRGVKNAWTEVPVDIFAECTGLD